MNKIKLSLWVFGLFLIQLSPLHAQIPILGTETLTDQLRLNAGIEGEKKLFYDDVQGDPFIFKEFKEGTLYVVPDKKYNINIRYDIYADQMHVKTDGQIYAIIHPEKVKMIEAGDYKFIYSAYIKSQGDKESEKSGYFILKADGKCKLLLKKNLRVQDAEPAKLYQDAKPPKFVFSGDSFFLKIDGNIAIRIKSKSDLLTVLADKSGEIESYMSSKKLGVKDIGDLEKIVTYYNTL